MFELMAFRESPQLSLASKRLVIVFFLQSVVHRLGTDTFGALLELFVFFGVSVGRKAIFWNTLLYLMVMRNGNNVNERP